jgi:hypothetical protein
MTEVRCYRPATLELFQVIDNGTETPLLLPAGLFCAEHCMEERGIRLAQGERTGISPWKGDLTPCCWVPLAPRSPGAPPSDRPA